MASKKKMIKAALILLVITLIFTYGWVKLNYGPKYITKVYEWKHLAEDEKNGVDLLLNKGLAGAIVLMFGGTVILFVKGFGVNW